MAYDNDEVLKLLQIMDLGVQWPDLKSICDAAHGDLLQMIADEKEKAAAEARPRVIPAKAEPIKPTVQVGNTDTPIKRLGEENG